MDTHKDASLVLRQKSIANARSVMEGGWSKAASARAFHTTPKAVAQWVARFRAEGLAGLQDHSRPRSVPSQAALALCARVEVFRRQRHAGEQIAAEISVSAATVTRILKRLRLNRLSALEPAEPIGRYELAAPGEIIHIDIKKLGKFNRIRPPVSPAGRFASCSSTDDTTTIRQAPGSPENFAVKTRRSPTESRRSILARWASAVHAADHRGPPLGPFRLKPLKRRGLCRLASIPCFAPFL